MFFCTLNFPPVVAGFAGIFEIAEKYPNNAIFSQI